MNTTQTEALLTLICKLPEIEFAEILKGMAEHINREKLDHLIDQSFSIETYESELEDAERALTDLEHEKDELVDKIGAALELCNNFMPDDDAQEWIDKIRKSIK